jgi:hypothetical protein
MQAKRKLRTHGWNRRGWRELHGRRIALDQAKPGYPPPALPTNPLVPNNLPFCLKSPLGVQFCGPTSQLTASPLGNLVRRSCRLNGATEAEDVGMWEERTVTRELLPPTGRPTRRLSSFLQSRLSDHAWNLGELVKLLDSCRKRRPRSLVPIHRERITTINYGQR